jgi:nitrogen fixation NifU-like protein
MSELQELYRNPRNFGTLDAPDRVVDGVNPLCGDKLKLYIKLDDDRIEDIRFEGTGCAISVASTSLMTERVKGSTIDEALHLQEAIHQLLTDASASQEASLGKLAALGGVREFPSRVKCAALSWHALRSGLTDGGTEVSTE